MRSMNNSYEPERRSRDPLIDELFVEGSLTQAERNRIHTFLSGAHCRNLPARERRLSDVAKALQFINKTRRHSLSPQLLMILTYCAEECGQDYFLPLQSDFSIGEKVALRRREYDRRREHDSLIIRLHDTEGKSFPEIGSMFGRTAGHTNRLYVREIELRRLEAELRRSKPHHSTDRQVDGNVEKR